MGANYWPYSIALGATSIARYAIGSALLAALGVAIGSLIRAELVAVVIILLWGFFVESTLSTQVNPVGPYLPFTAATTLAGARLATGGFGFPNSSPASPLAFGVAVLLLAGLSVVVPALAAPTSVSADIA